MALTSRVQQLIASLTAALRQARPTEGLNNPYDCPTAATNLNLFLELAATMSPAVILIGEAPGYRGAAVTGVPFASLDTLLTSWGDPWGAFGPKSGFAACLDEGPTREATATVFWRTLARLQESALPVTWNAVPFHPASPDGRNRSPLASEVRLGLPYLEVMLTLFPSARPIAVGNRASESLARLGVGHMRVRHPSFGGASQFASQLDTALAS